MMQRCALCPEWAQYRLRERVFKVGYDYVPDEERTKRDEQPRFKKKTVNLPDWKNVALLCGAHKEDRMGVAPDVETRVDFIGCAPQGMPCH